MTKIISLIAVASFLLCGITFAAPTHIPTILRARQSCATGSIGPVGAGNAACSASCLIQHGDIHGGHCDANGICVCN
ncbi:hypothetical protein TWF694_003345 [Orbilia ellipsospora]|uniref:Invertebrate defensins family profile domain-containing protein n=1 Tax=Orbilia ellipsospora TaxID=2528407 RepID=A0AAV9X171_9PEZI